jgi:antitoxin HicB
LISKNENFEEPLMFSFTYPAILKPEAATGGFVVNFPDIPEALTEGDDLTDALAQAADCLGAALEGYLEGGRRIPIPSKPRRGQRLIQVPLYLAPKLALYMAMSERRMNNVQLARKLGVSETVVRRMLNPKHDTKAEKIQAALEALGKRITVAVEDAA